MDDNTDTAEQPTGRASLHPTRLTPADLSRLFEALTLRGYSIVGPTIEAETIVYRKLTCPSQLPRGWQEEQSPGRYHLKPSPANTSEAPRHDQPNAQSNGPFFAHRLGPDSARSWFLPQQQKLWSATKNQGSQTDYDIFYPPERAQRQSQKLAFIGLRACDLKAIAIQDRVFLPDAAVHKQQEQSQQPNFHQQEYAAGRENTLIIAVNCTSHASTCFCTSMQSGPHVTQGYDIALTEVHPSSEPPAPNHYFVATSGSEAGHKLLQQLALPNATEAETRTAKNAVNTNATAIPKHDFSGVPASMKHQPEHPAWEEIAQTCLACGNCTLVCPTCFCTTVEDSTNLTGDTAERWLKWDTCFSEGHSYIHGGQVHGSIASRYRQWASHKLSSWHDQFGESGCVGCGRCVAWCPVGIDIRETATQFTDAATTTTPAAPTPSTPAPTTPTPATRT